MRELPFLANERTVRAILDGTQTQDRRPLRPQPSREIMSDNSLHWVYRWKKHNIPNWPDAMGFKRLMPQYARWQPGDRLYVRETWALAKQLDNLKPSQLNGQTPPLWYRADGSFSHWSCQKPYLDRGKWRPSIHMPKWASRIMLEVLDVRVERVQDISEADAIAEGISTGPWFLAGEMDLRPTQKETKVPLVVWRFFHLWNSIYAKKGLGFDVNPWVWVTTFKVLKGESNVDKSAT